MPVSVVTSQRRNMSSVLMMFFVLIHLQEIQLTETSLTTRIKLPEGCTVTMTTGGKVLACVWIGIVDVLHAIRQLGEELAVVSATCNPYPQSDSSPTSMVHGAELNQSCFEYTPKIRTLQLIHCSIEKVAPNTFQQLRNLTQLNLEDNQITEINNETFTGLQNLLKLALHNNYIDSIPRGTFKYINNLMVLDLRNNMIWSMDDGALSDLRHLESLILGHQRQDFRPSLHMLKGLTNLKKLDLSHINIGPCYVGGQYNNMSGFLKDQQNSLMKLDLSSTCFINTLSLMIRDLKRLEELNIRDNNLGYIAYGTLPKLIGNASLEISSNRIMFIEADALPYFGDGRKTMVDGNSFYCDCQLIEFVKWLRIYNTTHRKQAPILCSGPLHLYGTKVIDYDPSWWQCSPYVPLIALVAIICLVLVLAMIALVVSCNRVNFRHWLLGRRIAAKAEEEAEDQASTERTTLLVPPGRLCGISSLPKGRTEAYILYNMNEGDVKRWVDHHIEEKLHNHPMKIKLQWAAGPEFIPLWKQVKDYGLGVKHFLVVVTENLLKDHWPQMSENCSVENLSKFVLVLWGMKKKDLPKDLLRLSCPCLEWPLTAPKVVSLQREREQFWKGVRLAVKDIDD